MTAHIPVPKNSVPASSSIAALNASLRKPDSGAPLVHPNGPSEPIDCKAETASDSPMQAEVGRSSFFPLKGETASACASDTVPVAAVAPVASVAPQHGRNLVGTSPASANAVTSTPSQPVPTTKATSHVMRMATVRQSGMCLGRSRKLSKVCLLWTGRGYPEVLSVGSPEADALIRSLLRAKGQMAKKNDLADINDELRSMADEEGIDIEPFCRVAPKSGGGIELDLNDEKGTTVAIDASGVQIQQATSSTLFMRPQTSSCLPRPADKGDYMLMKRYVNLDDISFWLYLAFVTYTIAHPKVESSKYVFLVFKGTQGSGKSFASKSTQKLIDPSTTGAQTMPGPPRDLAIMSQSAHLLVFDNLRDLNHEMSDALCIAATGGTVALRQLYTDEGQKNLYLHGAMLFNGIHPFMGQSDFADRCMVLNLRPLPSESRRSEAEMLAQFSEEYPVILRGMYDLIAATFRRIPTAVVTSPSRMVDLCRWIAGFELACEMPQGTLQAEYDNLIQDMQLETLQDNPLAAAILEFAEKMEGPHWAGSPTAFYAELEALVSFSGRKSRGWPTNAATMSKRLHGLQAPLLAQGIEIELSRGKDRKITLRKPGGAPAVNSPSSLVSKGAQVVRAWRDPLADF